VSPSRAGSRDTASMSSLVLAVTGFIVLAALYIEIDLMPTSVLQALVGDVGYLGPVLAVLVLAVFAIFRSRGLERRLWSLVAATYVTIVAADLLWIWIVVSTGSPPAPMTPAYAVLHIVAALLYLAVVATLSPLVGSHRLVLARQILDVVSFAIVVYVAAYFLSITPLFSQVPGSTAIDTYAGAVYPTWAILMLAGLIWPSVVSGRGHLRRTWQRLLFAALVVYAIALGAWPLWFAWFMGPSATGDQVVVEVLQILSHYLLVLALLDRLRQPDERWGPPRAAGVSNPVARGAAYLLVGFVMIAMPIMIGLAIAAPDGSLTRSILGTASALLATLTVARTLLTAIESGRLFRRSITDPLTGLFNHRHFHEQLRSAIDSAARFDGTVAVIALDLDGFDEVNGRHGHPVGDDILRQIGAGLREACVDVGVMCRVGGDEFAAVLPGADAEAALRVAVAARRNLAAISTPDGSHITASSGIAVFPLHANDADVLMRFADGAAYWVKRHGKDHALVYDPAIVTELSPADLLRVAEQQAECGIVRALAAAVDARHEYTSTHSVAVAAWSTDVARRLGLDEQRIRLVETAALLHDVGMVAVSEDVFDKPEALAQEEIDEVRTHAPLGERIVSGTMQEPVLAIIRHHHERWDGAGYPDGLRAVAIPLEARILAVCGAYDAMTSPRPFRAAMSVAQAVEELRAGSGTQFDPAVVEVFLEGLGALGRLRSDL
jgi:diguanylate cyclase (GGDEF)-like protein